VALTLISTSRGEIPLHGVGVGREASSTRGGRGLIIRNWERAKKKPNRGSGQIKKLKAMGVGKREEGGEGENMRHWSQNP